MKITIARIRSGIKYEKPLTDAMDSFYEMFESKLKEIVRC